AGSSWGVRTVGPGRPVVELARGFPREAGHDQVLVPQPVGDIETPLPPDEQRDRRDVSRGRAQSFAIEGGPDLLRRAAEVTERPEQLDVAVHYGALGGEGAVGD